MNVGARRCPIGHHVGRHDDRLPRRLDRLCCAIPSRSILVRLRGFAAVVREQEHCVIRTQKTQQTLSICWVLSSGDVLLSHDLSSHYHWGCSVSLPCSEWERVVPLRYDRQSADPHGRFRCCRSDASAKPNSGDYLNFSKNTMSDVNREPSEIKLLAGSLISTHRVWEQHFLELRFVFKIIWSLLFPRHPAGAGRRGLTEK